jgi:hypothetical protein
MSFEEAMKRVEIIPHLHGKITREGKLSEPDIYYIVEKWLARHPKLKARQRDIRIVRGRWTLPQGVRTEVVSVSILAGNDIAGYDSAEDAELYEYWLAEEQEES